jgi:hypothetical protein
MMARTIITADRQEAVARDNANNGLDVAPVNYHKLYHVADR